MFSVVAHHEGIQLHNLARKLILLAPGRFGCDSKCVHFKHILRNDILNIQVNIYLEWMPEDLVDVKWTLARIAGAIRQQAVTWANAYPANFSGELSLVNLSLGTVKPLV